MQLKAKKTKTKKKKGKKMKQRVRTNRTGGIPSGPGLAVII